jgi:DNA-binding NtrC family response regulator
MDDKKPSVSQLETPTRGSGSWVKTRERVLVISDSEEMREQLIGLLGREDFVVFDQPSAIGATRSIRLNGIRAVVIDIDVPGFPASKLISVLRENPRLAGLVVVVITPDGDEQKSARGLESANATLNRSSLEYRLCSVLGRLLRSSSFRPPEASSAADKS